MEPFTLLGFLVAARTRMNNYRGNAPEGENINDNNRPFRRLAQIIHNSVMGSVQISVQQCVLNIANIPSHSSSEFYKHVFAPPAIKRIRQIFSEMNGINQVNTNDRNVRHGLTSDIEMPQEDLQEERHIPENEQEQQDHNLDNENINSRIINEVDPFELLNAQQDISNTNKLYERSVRTTEGRIFIDAQD
jgi:hypothetical protein